MKIALPSNQNQIDEHFGHCEHFTVFIIDDQKKNNNRRKDFFIFNRSSGRDETGAHFAAAISFTLIC